MFSGMLPDASFYSPCKSGIYVDSARGIYIDSSSLSFSAKCIQVLIEIIMLQKLESQFWIRKNEIIMESHLDRKGAENIYWRYIIVISTNVCQLIASDTCFPHDFINQTKTLLEYGKVQNNRSFKKFCTFSWRVC